MGLPNLVRDDFQIQIKVIVTVLILFLYECLVYCQSEDFQAY
jgi:hypothetical protein